MATVIFDTLAYVRKVMAAGVSREQAEAQAEAMKDAFEHNVDTLVTREFLDTRLAQLRLELRGEIGDLRGILNLHSWMLGLLIVTTVVPALLKLLA
jgi:hypothetical protein